MYIIKTRIKDSIKNTVNREVTEAKEKWLENIYTFIEHFSEQFFRTNKSESKLLRIKDRNKVLEDKEKLIVSEVVCIV